MEEHTNARILIEPHVARALTERHGEPRRGNTPASGTNRTQVINRDLHRYYDLLRHAQRRLRGRFSDDEQRTILAALQSTFLGAWQTGMLAVEVRDYLEDVDDAEVDADGDPLVAKLAALSETEELAIIDAIERWKLHKNRAVPIF